MKEADLCSSMNRRSLNPMRHPSEPTNRQKTEMLHQTRLRRRRRMRRMLTKSCMAHRDMRRCKAATSHHRHNSSWGFRVMRVAFENQELFSVMQCNSSRRLYNANRKYRLQTIPGILLTCKAHATNECRCVEPKDRDEG